MKPCAYCGKKIGGTFAPFRHMESKHADKVRAALKASTDSAWTVGLCDGMWFTSGNGETVIE